MDSLQSQNITQSDMDIVYGQFTKFVMKICIPHRTVKIGVATGQRRLKKSWWTPELDKLKSDVREAESRWLVDKNNLNLKQLYIEARKSFDTCVQRSKRQSRVRSATVLRWSVSSVGK